MPRRKGVVARRPSAVATRSDILPRNRWEFLGWIFSRWDRWFRVVLFLLVFIVAVRCAYGREIAVVLSRLP